MLISEPGKIGGRIYFLGTHQSCLYLVTGKDAMIIGGGMTSAVPNLQKQLSALDFDLIRIKYLVITHSHFDHCGAVPYLKRKFPWLQVLASPYAKDLFSKEKVINFIADANRQAMGSDVVDSQVGGFDTKVDAIKVDRVVVANDVIDLGEGLEAQFIETPGHTRCSIAIYIPALKALFPSDAAPCPTNDGMSLINPSPQYNYSLYLESLKKLAGYEPEICAFEHYGTFTGEMAKNIIKKALENTEIYVRSVKDQYRQIGDLDKLVTTLVYESMKKNQLDFLGFELQKVAIGSAVRNIMGLTLQK